MSTKLSKNFLRAALTVSLFAGPVILVERPLWAQSTGQTKPDNSAVNKRDRDPGAVTADQQKMNQADQKLVAGIRKAVMADKSLSTYAHNIKIVSQDGVVTLKGPVRSDEEAQAIVAKAMEVTGSRDKVVNQMSVSPGKK